ncbi:MAG: tRNA pseudouridine(55) synthase TruB [Candidatus Buchananbacteria bacterium]|nr:tRNA pseudouridine(55) synthase TruB [Candidatus Buchananbacteria bacterium]
MKAVNIFTISKPKRISSFGIINKIKKSTGEPSVGHAGTLDPLAEGVLVVGLGREATKKLSQIVEKEKEYIAGIKLGLSSSTDDSEGRKNKTPNVRPITLKEINSVVKNFIGTISQVPPAYSAIRLGGERAYKLARSGRPVELKSRPVEIKSLKILKYKWPDLKIKVVTGPGVYIRSLARDIGTSLSTGAYMSSLKRTRVGNFKINQAISLEALAKKYLAQRIDILKKGGVGIIPTDTIYGLVGRAWDKKAVGRIYKIRKRNPDKPFIILISSLADLKKFGVKIDQPTEKIIKKYWPGPVSIILNCDKKLSYLHRGTDSLAFRWPNNSWLMALLKKTGPLVAPSANPEGQEPALTIKQAKRYFSNNVDFYIDQGKVVSQLSALIKVVSGRITVLRPGALNMK